METKRLEVTAEGKKVYDIVIENNFNQLVKELSVFGIKERKLCIVTERQVAAYYLEEECRLFEKECAKLEVYIFQEGEESKNLSTVDSLYHFLITHEFDRKDMLLALGGGVTGDLTGFAAATYLRGIDFVQIPTSLLAQVDSSIGGKTGVDYHAYKNMVGASYMPKLVYINVNTMKLYVDTCVNRVPRLFPKAVTLVPRSTLMVLITDSFAVNPVIKEVVTLKSPNPSGAKTGAITRPINASRLSALSATTFSLVSKDCKNQIIIVARKITVNALCKKSFALSHIRSTTLFKDGSR